MSSGYPGGRDQRNRVHQPVQPCRSCQRRMLWVTMPSGKRNPVDLDPLPTDPEPNVLVVESVDRTTGEKWRLGVLLHDSELIDEARALGFRVATSHFATCPDATDRRRPRERADIDG